MWESPLRASTSDRGIDVTRSLLGMALGLAAILSGCGDKDPNLSSTIETSAPVLINAPVNATSALPIDSCSLPMPAMDDGPTFRCECQRTAPDGSRWLTSEQIEGDVAFHALLAETLLPKKGKGCYWGLDFYLDRDGGRLRPTYRRLLRASTKAQWIQMLRHESPRIRIAAAEAIALFSPKDIGAAEPLLRDESMVVVMAPDRTATVARTVRRSLCRVGAPEVVSLLLEKARSSASYIDRFAMLRCARLHKPREAGEIAVTFVREASGSSWVREAVRTLAVVGVDGYLEDLRALSDHSDASVRLSVAQALSGSRSRVAITLLKKLLADPDSDVRVAAKVALVTLGERPLRDLTELFLSTDSARTAARSIAWNPTSRTAPVLIAYLRESPDADTMRLLAEGAPTRDAQSVVRGAIRTMDVGRDLDDVLRFLRDAKDPQNAPVFGAILSHDLPLKGGSMESYPLVIQGLGKLGPAAGKYESVLEAQLKGGAPLPLGYATVEALADIGARDALERLRSKSSDPSDSYVADLIAEMDVRRAKGATGPIP